MRRNYCKETSKKKYERLILKCVLRHSCFKALAVYLSDLENLLVSQLIKEYLVCYGKGVFNKVFNPYPTNVENRVSS